jgi:hypothetical protein
MTAIIVLRFGEDWWFRMDLQFQTSSFVAPIVNVWM